MKISEESEQRWGFWGFGVLQPLTTTLKSTKFKSKNPPPIPIPTFLNFEIGWLFFVDYILSFFIFDNGYCIWSYFGRLALVVEMGMGGGFLLLWRLGVVVMMILSPTKEPRLLLPTVRHVRISICGFQKNWDTVFRREGIRRKHLKNWLGFWGGRLI